MKRFTIEDPVYGQHLHVVLNTSPKAFFKLVKSEIKIGTFSKDDDITPTDGAAYFMFKDNSGDEHCYLWMESFNKSTHNISALIHELYHHMCYAMSFVEVKDEEASAYYLTFLCNNALSKLA